MHPLPENTVVCVDGMFAACVTKEMAKVYHVFFFPPPPQKLYVAGICYSRSVDEAFTSKYYTDEISRFPVHEKFFF